MKIITIIVMRFISLMCFLLIVVISINAQEQLVPIYSNPKVKNLSSSSIYKRTAALSLPFVEDFYQSGVHPNLAKWQDNLVYVNQTLPINPISIGVASFDGLNSFGNPYSILANASGAADYLTSQSIDLSGLSRSDNVYLSFFYQFLSLGESPDANSDFLRLEFYDEDGNWQQLWQITPPTNATQTDFTQQFIAIDTPFLHSNFQFRFYNIGSLTGMNDIWNLDYIRLDKDRDSTFDKNIADMAFQYPAPSLLEPYYSMPYSHFDTTYLKDTVTLLVKNNFINPTTNFIDNYECVVANDASILTTFTGPTRDFLPLTVNKLNYTDFPIPTTYTDDTVIITTTYNFDVIAEDNTNSTIVNNNTFIHQQVFDNYFSYDDGSAERGYWISDAEDYKLAVKYNLSHEDTLRAIKFQFTPVQNGLSSALFSVIIWKNIIIGSNTEQIIYKQDNLTLAQLIKEYSYDTINGYLYYPIKSDFIVDNNYNYPLVLADSFYVGLLVNTANSLTIGFDRNTDKKQYNYYFLPNIQKWYQTGFDGTMIINPVVGKELAAYLTPIKEIPTYQFSIYPNPTQKYVYIKGINDETAIAIYDINGSLLQAFNTKIDRVINVEQLAQGMYFIKLTNLNTKQTGIQKLIKY